MSDSGYVGIGPEDGNFVSSEEAYSYALDRLENCPEEKDAFIEWYYSGNWIHVEDGDVSV